MNIFSRCNEIIEAECESIMAQAEADGSFDQWLIEHKRLISESRWLSPAKEGIDYHIFRCLTSPGPTFQRFFIEAGANNGIRQSNTFNAEHAYGCTGILVEPIMYNFLECRRYRPNSICINAVLGDHNGKITGQFADELKNGRVENDNGLGSGCTQDHIESYPELLKEVEMITFEKLNVMFAVPERYAFLSLDVEGFEKMVINDNSFSAHRPNTIMIETSDKALEKTIIQQGYKLWGRPTDHDVIFKDIL
jgi:FkbM family methyltransferase